jgi:hypothetical protein
VAAVSSGMRAAVILGASGGGAPRRTTGGGAPQDRATATLPKRTSSGGAPQTRWQRRLREGQYGSTAVMVSLREHDGGGSKRRTRGGGSQRRARDVGSSEARAPEWHPLASHLKQRRRPSLGTSDDDKLP